MNGDKARRKRRPDEVGEDWITIYADAITLLMAFFVMLATFSRVDVPIFEQVQAGIAQELGGRQIVQPINLLESQLDAVIDTLGVADAVEVDTDEQGVVLEFAANAFYQSGSALIRPQARPIIENLAKVMLTPRNARYRILIEGHTDDVPIQTPQFPSNWELSAARAVNVVHVMISQGIPPRRLAATGLADTQPKLPNRDAIGNPIPENQADNRRIVIHLQR